jgi:hypothetical protein
MNALYTLWADDLHEDRKLLDELNLEETFAGSRHHFTDHHTCVLSCLGTIDQLTSIPANFPLASNLSVDSLIASDSLQRLFTPRTPQTPSSSSISTTLAASSASLGDVLFAFKGQSPRSLRE